jgi:hypothetical protein
MWVWCNEHSSPAIAEENMVCLASRGFVLYRVVLTAMLEQILTVSFLGLVPSRFVEETNLPR